MQGESSDFVSRLEVLLPDGNGILRGKWLLGAELDKLKRGTALPLSVFGLDPWGEEVLPTGLHAESGDRDGLCFPVKGRSAPIPWSENQSVQVLMAMQTTEGEAIDFDPRGVCTRLVKKLADKGYSPTVAFELEFFLLNGPDEKSVPDPILAQKRPGGGSVYGLGALDQQKVFFGRLLEAAEAQNLPVSAMSSESAPGQFEVNLRHRPDALAAADDAILLRRLIEGLAHAQGLRATFMAKPNVELSGSGMHVHMSLMDKHDKNAFAGEAGAARLESVSAALVKFMAESILCFAGNFNGMRRLAPGSYAPTWASWGRDNRSVALRLPNADSENQRFEHRVSGANANPYLVLAALLAGVIEGLEQTYALPPEVKVNADTEGPFEPAQAFPQSFAAAVEAFENSAHLKKYLGENFTFVHHQLKLQELRAFENYISSFERETYL